MMKAPRNIIAPGPEGRVIKQGEPVAVIRTPKGIYIKLTDGKIFAVRSQKDAANFGMQAVFVDTIKFKETHDLGQFME